MKLTFIFSESPDAEDTKSFHLNTDIQFPDAALQFPDCRERILALAAQVGALTQVVLHISCKEMGLKLYPVKLTHEEKAKVGGSFRDLVLSFQRRTSRKFEYAYIKIVTPFKSPFIFSVPNGRKGSRSLQKYLIKPQNMNRIQPQQQPYLDAINVLADMCLTLLNSDVGTTPVDGNSSSKWSFEGFHPYWFNEAAITKASKNSKRMRNEQRRKEKQEARLQVQQAAQPFQSEHSASVPQTGAGRRVGAVPGIFKGVQFRSQLEIRFVTQLEEMGIRWVYESERLGDGNYLVDFYLPDLKIWVEVKGQFEPRDNFLLKEVAAYLKRERNERLYVYSASKGYAVNSRSFHAMPHKLFWTKIGR